MFGCLSSDWLQMTTLGCEHLAGVQTVRLTDETASPAPLPPPCHCSWAVRFARCEMGGHFPHQ